MYPGATVLEFALEQYLFPQIILSHIHAESVKVGIDYGSTS